jgi:DNA (cytosine-5)-methyltransferase 1
MNFIDLFSGAGGLSEGFINVGFKPVAHVEMDKSACETLETRLAYHSLREKNNLDSYYDYIQGKLLRKDFIENSLSTKERESVINLGIGCKNNKEIFRRIDGLLGSKKVDLLIGGPPCQAYSLVGRARDSKGMKDDPRNFLYKEYGKFLKYYSPTAFVFENVLGLITAEKGMYFKNMKKYFKTVGYELDYEVLKSEDFGVLQKRRRIILIGWEKGLEFKYPEFDYNPSKYTVNSILEDLKPIKAGIELKVSKYHKRTNDYLSNSEIRNGVDFVTQHIARPHNERDLKIYKIAVKKLKKGERLKYPDLPCELKTHKNEKSFLDRFKVVDGNGLSHTMVAHIAKDGHHYIHPDIKQNRSLTVREAARVQSFPDNYYFEGGRTAAFRQIGNAVPPLMAKCIAEKLSKKLCPKKK